MHQPGTLISRATALVASVLVSLLVSGAGLGDGWLQCRMARGAPKACCCHKSCDPVQSTHDAPTVTRAPCCTKADGGATVTVPATTASLALFLVPAPWRAVESLAAPVVDDVQQGGAPLDGPHVSTGPPIPIRLRHLLI